MGLYFIKMALFTGPLNGKTSLLVALLKLKFMLQMILSNDFFDYSTFSQIFTFSPILFPHSANTYLQ